MTRRTFDLGPPYCPTAGCPGHFTAGATCADRPDVDRERIPMMTTAQIRVLTNRPRGIDLELSPEQLGRAVTGVRWLLRTMTEIHELEHGTAEGFDPFLAAGPKFATYPEAALRAVFGPERPCCPGRPDPRSRLRAELQARLAELIPALRARLRPRSRAAASLPWARPSGRRVSIQSPWSRCGGCAPYVTGRVTEVETSGPDVLMRIRADTGWRVVICPDRWNVTAAGRPQGRRRRRPGPPVTVRSADADDAVQYCAACGGPCKG